MYSSPISNVDAVSTNVLGLLTNLATRVLHIEDNSNELLKHEEFAKDVDFQKFIIHNLEGMYRHFRAQGYLEALVSSKYYTMVGINTLLNKLLFPAIDHYEEAESHLMKVKNKPQLVNKPGFSMLLENMKEFKNVLGLLTKEISRYGIRH